MQEFEKILYDKSSWDPGPWHAEPDQAQWVDEATKLPCLAKRNRYGAWCGYVGVPPEHPDYGKHYDDLKICVHGGLTYAAENGPSGVIFDEPNSLWLFGFDCAHVDDYPPINLIPELYASTNYKTLAFVKEQVALLAAQLKTRDETPA